MENHKVEEFKSFVRNNPFLISYIRKGEKSWQDFYEMYDMYGDDEEAWSKYFVDDHEKDTSKTDGHGGKYFDEIVKMAKNIDMNKVQEGISSLQKTLGLFGELFVSKENNSKEYNPRPLYRRFED